MSLTTYEKRSKRSGLIGEAFKHRMRLRKIQTLERVYEAPAAGYWGIVAASELWLAE